MGSIRWTPWKPLATCQEQRLIPPGPGAYRIRCRGCTIGRVVGRDREGVLDIGKSVHLRRRLAAFFRCVTADHARHGHMAGWRYRDLGLHRHFPPDRLEVCWCEAEDEDEALRLEAKALEDYAKLHGELPPLNYGSNWAAREGQARRSPRTPRLTTAASSSSRARRQE
jgi:hypothetical protein